MCGVSAAANVIVHIATPDADSLRRSEAYITRQIARAVARGQRSFEKTSDGNFQLAQVCRYRSESLNVMPLQQMRRS